MVSKYPFYLRLSVVDKDGNPVTDLSGFTLKRNGSEISDTQLGTHEWGLACYKNAKGVYCLRDKKEGASGSFSDLNFTISCPSDKKIDDYNVVVYVGNEQPSISGNLIMEEPTLVGRVNYTILSQSTFDAIKLTPSTEPTGAAVRNVSSIVLGTNLNVDLTSKDNLKFIKEQLSLSETQNFGKLYVRWAIKKKDGSAITGVSSKGALKQQEGMYWTWYSDDASSSFANALNANFVVPEGLDINDVDISCVISDETPTTQYGFVTTEPTLKAKVNVQLLDKYSMPFNHYVGHANTVFDENGMQQTAEWEYYVYVKDAGDNVELVLPFDKYTGSGDALEPKGYFRWYDINKDKACGNLQKNGTTSLLNSIVSDGEDYGLFAYNLSEYPVSKNIGVTYKAPAEAASEDWAGEDIACDVSRYVDGLDASKTYLVHEPTLSIRYIYHIRSAKQLADDIMNTAIGNNPQKSGYRTYEDGKKLTVGMKDKSSTLTLRLDLSDSKKYYFHPLADDVYKSSGSFSGFTHRVYYADEKDKLVESDFDNTKICRATQIEWWAYDKTKTYCCNLGTSVNRFFDLTMNKLDGSWMSVSLNGEVKNFTFQYGDPVFIVAYAMDDEYHRCPIANFDVRFMNNHPMTKEKIIEDGLNNRLISYLDDHYAMATKPITFDDDDDEQTLAAPTNPDDNQDRLPSKWDRRSYGFVYRDLINYTADGGHNDMYNNPCHSPLHGEYGIYKTANVTGISGSNTTDGYIWYQSGDTHILHDKTYESTNGSQYGHFLYVDASDESRNIAAAEFTADLCTGQQLIFIAGVADMTDKDIKPQLMFKLFGVNYDANRNIVSKQLIHSFSSGDFLNNVDGELKEATWYQVYGKIVLQKESEVEKFSDFRLEIDNYCKGTLGADYAVDDIRMYIEPAKVQVLQEKPACGGATTGTIKLKIRAIHETLNAILGHQDTKIYFRFVDEDGKPVTGEGLYSYKLKNIKAGTEETVSGNDYGTVNVYDSEEACKNFEIDGTNMIEVDSEGETYIVISNKDYPLTIGKKYYVSVSTGNPAEGKANWGSPAEICSVYSNWFEMVSQHPIITDTDGNIVTDYKIPCDQAGNYEVKIKGQLTTADPHNGGKITLNNVKFYWYLDGKDDAHKLSETASNEITISKDQLPLGETHTIYMKPEGTPNVDGYIPYEINGTTYLLCTEAIPVDLRVMKDGPKLNFGFNDVDYPFNDGSYEASLRIGLPQLEKLKASNGYLKVPLHSATMSDGTVITGSLTFIDDSGSSADASTKVYIASTNDPLWEKKLNTQVATLENAELPAFDKTTQATLNLKFEDAAVENFHEGYYYVLRFVYEKRAAADATTNCPGESYLKLKIVPEFITWTPTADGGMNANWNNDDNWHRSSSTELYDDKYEDYQAYGSASGITAKVEIPTLNSYVPMKFTKVTIGNLNGLPFPDLGNIVYRSTNAIATKLTNGKGNEATKYIQYDIMAYWDEADTEKGFAEGNLKCEKFYGNTCHQIYFKPQGELRDQCYLIYDKAWVEKELVPNKWYTMASPLQYIYAGDMYVTAKDGRQETKAFTDITFDDKTADGTSDEYSRSKYPVYQRAWMKSGVEEITAKDKYPASHYPEGAKTDDMNLNLGYWSHVYNKVNESYAADGTFGGFAIKAGNALLPKDQTKNALLRLPKEDKEYQYFDYTGSKPSSSKIPVAKNAGHGKLLVAFNNDEKHLAQMVQTLGTDNNSGFYLVANPYTCSISLKKFFEVNTGLQNAVWLIEGDAVRSVSSTDLSSKDFVIQPTQSFFVKKMEEASVSEVKFTSAMYVDRLLSSGIIIASDYLKDVNVSAQNAKGQCSKARIAVREEASDDYDEQEDVDLLCDQNLKDIPQVYTVAGSQAVAVNATPKIEWMPMGVIMENGEKNEMVNLDFKGVAKLDALLYLYDAANGQYTELQDGNEVSIQANEHGRYFLTQTRGTTGIQQIEAEAESNQLKVYSPAAGMIVVSALNGEKLGRVEVFTLDGKMVHSYQLPDKQRMILRVPSGVYIVKASTQSCAQAKGQKVAVR
nr:T9SS type A sorting domain-containing protein [uncultured Prevotella sp.]